MTGSWKKLLLHLALPLGVGGLSALLAGGMADYSALNQPPLSPPGWLFPIVWTALYLAMGYGAYRVQRTGDKPQAMTLYGLQLFFNFLWPLIFFRLHAYWAALGILVLLWALILLTLQRFRSADAWAGRLLIPYLVWVTFAGYLNFGVALLN